MSVRERRHLRLSKYLILVRKVNKAPRISFLKPDHKMENDDSARRKVVEEDKKAKHSSYTPALTLEF